MKAYAELKGTQVDFVITDDFGAPFCRVALSVGAKISEGQVQAIADAMNAAFDEIARAEPPQSRQARIEAERDRVQDVKRAAEAAAAEAAAAIATLNAQLEGGGDDAAAG